MSLSDEEVKFDNIDHIRPGLRCLPVTNALAYFTSLSVMKLYNIAVNVSMFFLRQ